MLSDPVVVCGQFYVRLDVVPFVLVLEHEEFAAPVFAETLTSSVGVQLFLPGEIIFIFADGDLL
jgi:hypothetical protein